MEKRSPAVPEPMEMLAGHITDYLHYLKHDCGLRVSIHEFQRIAAPFLAQFLPYRIHDNPSCLQNNSCLTNTSLSMNYNSFIATYIVFK